MLTMPQVRAAATRRHCVASRPKTDAPRPKGVPFAIDTASASSLYGITRNTGAKSSSLAMRIERVTCVRSVGAK